MIKYIHGPVSLTQHYSKVYDKHIYIFGDIHVNQLKPCSPNTSMHIIDFILNYIRWNYDTNNQITDIFLETGKFSRDCPKGGVISCDMPQYQPCPIAEVIDFFRNFLRYDKSKIENQFDIKDKCRFHYADIRHSSTDDDVRFIFPSFGFISELKQVINDLAVSFQGCCQSDSEVKDAIDGTKQINEFLSEILIELNREINNEYETTILQTGLDKELSKLSNIYPNMSEELRYMTNKKHSTIISIIQKIEQLTNNLDELVTKNIIACSQDYECLSTVIKKYINYIVEIIVQLTELESYYIQLFMDEYLLARIFKNPEFKDIIIYVGNNHAERYRNFLKGLQFNIGKEAYNVNYDSSDIAIMTNIQCIDVEHFNFQISPSSYCEEKDYQMSDDMIYLYSYKLNDRICISKSKLLELKPIKGLVQIGDFIIPEDSFNDIKYEIRKNNAKYIYLGHVYENSTRHIMYYHSPDFQTANRNRIGVRSTSPSPKRRSP